MFLDQVVITNSLLNSINSIFSSFFASVDTELYSLLDDMVFINSTEFVEKGGHILQGTESSPRNHIYM